MTNRLLMWVIGLCVIWPSACAERGEPLPDTITYPTQDVSDTVSDNDTAPKDAIEEDTSATDVEDTESTASTDVTPADDTEVTPTLLPGWNRLLLGAQGDLHQVRFLDQHGFWIVGDNGTVLRPIGNGWVRAWAPFSALSLRDVASSSRGLVAVGDSGTWLVRDSAGAWRYWDAEVGTDLTALALVPDGLLAVGKGGTILKDNGKKLQYEQINDAYDLLSVVSLSQGEAFAVGSGGLALRRALEPGVCPEDSGSLCTACTEDSKCNDGVCAMFLGSQTNQCTQECNSETPCPNGFECIDAETRWVCQPPPTVDWVVQSATADTITLRSAFAVDPFNVWAVGDDGVVAYYSGPWNIEQTDDTASRALHGVHGAGGWIYAIGENGTFLQRNSDGTWSLAQDIEGPLLSQKTYYSVAVGGGQVVAGGAKGALQIKTLPDQPFIDAPSTPQSTIRDIASHADTTAAVGDNGLMVLLDKVGYGALETGTNNDLNATYIDSKKVLWAAGAHGTILRRAPSSPVLSVPTDNQATLNGIAPLANGSLMAVGQAGIALKVHPSGSEVVVSNTGQSHDLMDVFVTKNGLTAVGEKGAAVQFQDGKWTPLNLGTTADLNAGDYINGQTVIVGTQGVVIHWADGKAPQAATLDPTALYYGVSVTNDGTASLVGWAGVLHQLSSEGVLQSMEAPTTTALYAIGEYAGAPLLGGASDTLWRYVPEDN